MSLVINSFVETEVPYDPNFKVYHNRELEPGYYMAQLIDIDDHEHGAYLYFEILQPAEYAHKIFREKITLLPNPNLNEQTNNFLIKKGYSIITMLGRMIKGADYKFPNNLNVAEEFSYCPVQLEIVQKKTYLNIQRIFHQDGLEASVFYYGASINKEIMEQRQYIEEQNKKQQIKTSYHQEQAYRNKEINPQGFDEDTPF